jgi:hypothetical protein
VFGWYGFNQLRAVVPHVVDRGANRVDVQAARWRYSLRRSHIEIRRERLIGVRRVDAGPVREPMSIFKMS